MKLQRYDMYTIRDDRAVVCLSEDVEKLEQELLKHNNDIEQLNAEMLEAVNNLIHQVEICLYIDSDIYDLKMNKAYIDLKQKAEAMR